MESISAIHPVITKNTEDSLVKGVPHISMRESHLISALSNSFHKVIAVRNLSAIFVSRTEAIIR